MGIYRGSSPLARGLRYTGSQGDGGIGIIPARAGFTRSLYGSTAARGDHPRSRGVYANIPFVDQHSAGSSPLARGLLGEEQDRIVKRRIIPARAGFTFEFAGTVYCEQDHPRSRGVYRGLWTIMLRLTGSSPLARGLLSNVPAAGYAGRIIPARAGFTRTHFAPCPTSRDHPRSRGVYCVVALLNLRPFGSSPLARGLLQPPRCL